jgi:DNA-binding HxlR family transcriptional regulator
MLGKTYDGQICSMARALELVGERWSLLILRDALFAGVTRFGDLQHNLGIATNVLASRLDGFVAAGIMERRPLAGQTDQHEYVPTDMGRDLGGVLVALTEWGDRWAAPEGPPILFRHADEEGCGGAVTAQLACAGCGLVAEPTDVRATPGPGMPASYLAARRPRRSEGD